MIKKLEGFSGSIVLLVSENDTTFVRKIDNIERNFEKLTELYNLGFSVPKILRKEKQILDLEYIPSLDLKKFLEKNPIDTLNNFLIQTLLKLAENTEEKDYSEVYEKKINEIDFSLLPFTGAELYKKLPKKLPKSNYFGDLTLENILFGNDGKFYLIDGSTVEYDSYIFDICKLRQDLTCGWFLRKEKNTIQVKLAKLEKDILNRFPEAKDDYLLILMLLRVYKHAEANSFEQKFLIEEIKKLWK